MNTLAHQERSKAATATSEEWSWNEKLYAEEKAWAAQVVLTDAAQLAARKAWQEAVDELDSTK